MTDLIREIEDETQRDAVRDFVRKYAALIAGALVALVIGIAAYLWWGNAQERQLANDSTRFGSALQSFQSDSFDDGIAQLGDLENASRGYALLARMEAASQYLERGELDNAIASWDRVINDANTSEAYVGLAHIYKAMALAGDGQYEAAIAATDQVDADNIAFSPLAMDLKGRIQWQSGDLEGALATFEALKAQIETAAYQSLARQPVALGRVDNFIELLSAE